MTSLDAQALHADPEGLAFLKSVLDAEPTEQTPGGRPPLKPANRLRSSMTMTKASRRLALIGATSMVGLLIAISPAKPMFPAAGGTAPAVMAASQPEPAMTRPVRSAPKITVADAAGSTCEQVRRKLWVEGEGWVIRRVGKCW